MGKRMMDVLDELVPEGATPGEMLRALRKREGLTLEEALSELEVMHSHCRPLDCFIESLRSSTRGIVR